jgi:hypothetical protein
MVNDSGEDEVPSYRLYRCDRFSGHITSVEEVISADDVGAICLVQDLICDVPMELWESGRKVCRFDAMPEQRPLLPNASAQG